MAEEKEVSEGSAAFRGTLVTLVFRLVSFLCTQATLRLLDPSTLGKANIQLELMLTTVLFISREGFRLSLTKDLSPDNWNVSWLTIPVVSLVSLSSLVWHLSVSADDMDYRLAGSLYCLASWIEGLAEPAVLHFLRQMDIAKRASAEGIGTVSKTLTTIIGLKVLNSEWHVTAFGFAQLIYAVTYALYLYWCAWKKLVMPTRALDSSTCYMTMVFTVQGFFKHLLTEADRIVLTAVSDNYDQGVYAMGSGYGGMAARILLQPLEENARLLWSRFASRKDSKSLYTSYTVLLKLVLYIGLLFSCLAPNYTNLLLCILAGRKWGGNEEAAAVLSAFCVYTAFLACNGMTEAFVYAVATSTAEVGRLGMAHTVTGGIFALSAFFLVSNHGTLGLVASNCIAMSMRSAYSISFAAKYFGKEEKKSTLSLVLKLVTEVLPKPAIILGFSISYVATRWSLSQLQGKDLHQILDYRNREWLVLTGQHLAVGISCVVGILSLVLTSERQFLRALKSIVRQKQD